MSWLSDIVAGAIEGIASLFRSRPPPLREPPHDDHEAEIARKLEEYKRAKGIK